MGSDGAVYTTSVDANTAASSLSAGLSTPSVWCRIAHATPTAVSSLQSTLLQAIAALSSSLTPAQLLAAAAGCLRAQQAGPSPLDGPAGYFHPSSAASSGSACVPTGSFPVARAVLSHPTAAAIDNLLFLAARTGDWLLCSELAVALLCALPSVKTAVERALAPSSVLTVTPVKPGSSTAATTAAAAALTATANDSVAAGMLDYADSSNAARVSAPATYIPLPIITHNDISSDDHRYYSDTHDAHGHGHVISPSQSHDAAAAAVTAAPTKAETAAALQALQSQFDWDSIVGSDADVIRAAVSAFPCVDWHLALQGRVPSLERYPALLTATHSGGNNSADRDQQLQNDVTQVDSTCTYNNKSKIKSNNRFDNKASAINERDTHAATNAAAYPSSLARYLAAFDPLTAHSLRVVAHSNASTSSASEHQQYLAQQHAATHVPADKLFFLDPISVTTTAQSAMMAGAGFATSSNDVETENSYNSSSDSTTNNYNAGPNSNIDSIPSVSSLAAASAVPVVVPMSGIHGGGSPSTQSRLNTSMRDASAFFGPSTLAHLLDVFTVVEQNNNTAQLNSNASTSSISPKGRPERNAKFSRGSLKDSTAAPASSQPSVPSLPRAAVHHLPAFHPRSVLVSHLYSLSTSLDMLLTLRLLRSLVRAILTTTTPTAAATAFASAAAGGGRALSAVRSLLMASSQSGAIADPSLSGLLLSYGFALSLRAGAEAVATVRDVGLPVTEANVKVVLQGLGKWGRKQDVYEFFHTLSGVNVPSGSKTTLANCVTCGDAAFALAQTHNKSNTSQDDASAAVVTEFLREWLSDNNAVASNINNKRESKILGDVLSDVESEAVKSEGDSKYTAENADDFAAVPHSFSADLLEAVFLASQTAPPATAVDAVMAQRALTVIADNNAAALVAHGEARRLQPRSQGGGAVPEASLGRLLSARSAGDMLLAAEQVAALSAPYWGWQLLRAVAAVKDAHCGLSVSSSGKSGGDTLPLAGMLTVTRVITNARILYKVLAATQQYRVQQAQRTKQLAINGSSSGSGNGSNGASKSINESKTTASTEAATEGNNTKGTHSKNAHSANDNSKAAVFDKASAAKQERNALLAATAEVTDKHITFLLQPAVVTIASRSSGANNAVKAAFDGVAPIVDVGASANSAALDATEGPLPLFSMSSGEMLRRAEALGRLRTRIITLAQSHSSSPSPLQSHQQQSQQSQSEFYCAVLAPVKKLCLSRALWAETLATVGDLIAPLREVDSVRWDALPEQLMEPNAGAIPTKRPVDAVVRFLPLSGEGSGSAK